MDESEHNRPKLENTVAVVSFAQTNADLHLTVAKTVTEEFKFDRVILGGVQNISSVKLTSKVIHEMTVKIRSDDNALKLNLIT